jgi:hypothetical protein
MAVGNKEVPAGIDLSPIDEITWYRIKTELLPVKRKKEKFNLDETTDRVKAYLDDIMKLPDSERLFMYEFREKKYHPEYLFDEPEIVDRLKRHPMAIWKMQNMDE